jgi:uncharacterized protein (DUF1697 family)
MPIYIAMFRGINVSGHKPIKMESLRAAFESLGFGDVKTYIQSGNIFFKTTKASPVNLTKKIAEKILDNFGFSVFVLVRTADEVGDVLKSNPLLQGMGIDESKLHVTFLSEPAPKEAANILKTLAAKSELFSVCGREIYLSCPDGYGNTKLSDSAIEKKFPSGRPRGTGKPATPLKQWRAAKKFQRREKFKRTLSLFRPVIRRIFVIIKTRPQLFQKRLGGPVQFADNFLIQSF